METRGATKYLPIYDQMLLDHLKQGNPFSTFLKVIYEYLKAEYPGLTREQLLEKCPCKRTMFNWAEKIEGFKIAKDVGTAYSEEVWLRKAQDAEKDPKFNTYYWMARMRNLFDYRMTDKKDIDSQDLSETLGAIIKYNESVQPATGSNKAIQDPG